ncbi:MAG: winged helix-turn-helix domain-containing protein [Ilumatobacter fluminis]|uniref:winged helix-turn-helix domain-containing protein n=1 Tax=Ilumatobacter fluminis TaxID=467091 RepID=UPI0032EB27B9
MERVIASRIRCPAASGLSRERLDLVLSQIERHRLTVVHAPAGSGKTTALAQFAHGTTIPVAWYTVDSLDGAASTFLAYLQRSIESAIGAAPGAAWLHADAALDALDAFEGPLAIVIDDFHLIAGGQAGDVLAHLVERLPAHVSIAVGTRIQPILDDARLQLMDDVLHIDADDLRFRTWEAEQLLDETWGFVLRPDDVARLTRSVGGWAAGFQLFRLAARDRTPAEQRRLARHASTRSRLARRYLAQHVLGSLTDELRTFLLHTSVLGVVTPDLADDLVGGSGSRAALTQLEASEVFVTRLDVDTYRYHEVLRAHLEAELADELPADELEARYERAAELLATAGFFGEAMRCHVRSGRAGDPARLAQLIDGEIALRNAGMLDALEPAEPSTGDPWLTVVRARVAVASGRFGTACDLYRQAERSLEEHAEARATCRRERSQLEAFLLPDGDGGVGWIGLLRLGLTDAPGPAAAALAQLGTVESTVASGALALLSGDLAAAARRFDAVLLDDDPADWAIHTGRLGRQLVRLLAGDGDAADLTLIDRLLVGLDGTWLGRLGGAVVAAVADPPRPDVARRLADRCAADGDPWGAIIAHLCAAMAVGDDDARRRHFEAAAELADRQHSAVLASSALAGLARLVPERSSVERRSRQLARKAGLRQPPLLVLVGADGPTDERPPEHLVDGPLQHGTTTLTGGFRLSDRHDAVDALRPRARAVLIRLAVDAGRPVDASALVDELWPDDEATGRRGIQVAVSAIRRALLDDDARRTVERIDDGYLLTVPAGAASDLDRFRADAAIAARSAVPAAERLAAAERALESVGGELLAGCGNPEWLIAARDQFSQHVARTAAAGAASALTLDDVPAAIRLAELGLEYDRFHDELWRLVVEAHERRGDTITADRLRRQYADMLDELGLEPATTPFT